MCVISIWIDIEKLKLVYFMIIYGGLVSVPWANIYIYILILISCWLYMKLIAYK